MEVREFQVGDLPQMARIWNEVVEQGVAFPQEDLLDEDSAARFFGQQTYTAVAADEDGTVHGLYILHPNNVGRCGHIGNASYAVSAMSRGQGVGEHLVTDSLVQAKARGFRILQFNAVVESNYHARRLYEKLGFRQIGTIPGGFRMKDGRYESICPYYYEL